MASKIKDCVRDYTIQKIFDVGCGDCARIKDIFSEHVTYIGADKNAVCIEKNRTLYSGTTSFVVFDITKDSIPEGMDLILCRDLLGHLSLNALLQGLENIRRSKAKFFLATTFMNRPFKALSDTADWHTQWQPLSLCSAPLYFPMPLEVYSERCNESFPKYMDKSLALWPVNAIPEFIPRKIFQLWHTKDLPPLLKEAGERIRAENPEFEHHVYDTAECDRFIEDNFEPRVLAAYRKLLPAAFRADLCRFCILYIYGGIYVDISFEPINGFTFLRLIHKEHFSSEVRLHPYGNDPHKGVSIGFMAVKQKSERILTCINKIVDNIEREDYGQGPYDITSAVVLGSCFTEEERKALREVRRVVSGSLNGYSYYGGGILRRMPDYDKGLPGRSGQSYLQDWWHKKVFRKT
jgi:hypothetical protein